MNFINAKQYIDFRDNLMEKKAYSEQAGHTISATDVDRIRRAYREARIGESKKFQRMLGGSKENAIFSELESFQDATLTNKQRKQILQEAIESSRATQNALNFDNRFGRKDYDFFKNQQQKHSLNNVFKNQRAW